MTQQCPKHKIFMGKAGCKRCLLEEQQIPTAPTKPKHSIEQELSLKAFEDGIRYVTRSRMFVIAFWPWSLIYEDKYIKKARKSRIER